MNSSAGLMVCAVFLSATSAIPYAAAADHVSEDATESKSSTASDPSESPRFLHDQHQTTQGR